MTTGLLKTQVSSTSYSISFCWSACLVLYHFQVLANVDWLQTRCGSRSFFTTVPCKSLNSYKILQSGTSHLNVSERRAASSLSTCQWICSFEGTVVMTCAAFLETHTSPDWPVQANTSCVVKLTSSFRIVTLSEYASSATSQDARFKVLYAHDKCCSFSISEHQLW